jgi:hypothetical protein
MGTCSSTPEDAASKEINEYLRREGKKMQEQVKLLLLGTHFLSCLIFTPLSCTFRNYHLC